MTSSVKRLAGIRIGFWLRTGKQWVFKTIQKIPTWLTIALTVLFLSWLAIWLHDEDLKILSIKDLFTPPVLKVLFENAESIAIVAAVILYFKEAPDRRDQKHYEAWQVIDNAAAAGVSTSYARIRAIEDLNRDGVSLKGMDIPGADLESIELPEADLRSTDLSQAVLVKATLNDANLNDANLYGANLGGANLSETTLGETNLSRANLKSANLYKVRTFRANFSDANLSGAKLSAASLLFANLGGANLSKANLMGANLGGADLNGTNLSGANVYGASLIGTKNLTASQAKTARNWECAFYSEDLREQLGLPPK